MKGVEKLEGGVLILGKNSTNVFPVWKEKKKKREIQQQNQTKTKGWDHIKKSQMPTERALNEQTKVFSATK